MPAAKPLEFRRRAVDLARTGDQPVAKIAKDLGSCLVAAAAGVAARAALPRARAAESSWG